jgi:hypothetical protein
MIFLKISVLLSSDCKLQITERRCSAKCLDVQSFSWVKMSSIRIRYIICFTVHLESSCALIEVAGSYVHEP